MSATRKENRLNESFLQLVRQIGKDYFFSRLV